MKMNFLSFCFLFSYVLALTFEFEGEMITTESSMFQHELPLKCVNENMKKENCEELLLKAANIFGARLLKFLSDSEGVLSVMKDVLLVISEDVDPRTTVHNICLGRNATQGVCAMLQHFISPHIPLKFTSSFKKSMISKKGECSQSQADHNHAYFRDKVLSLPHIRTPSSTTPILDAMFPVYRGIGDQNTNFPFSGSDDKVVAVIEAFFRSHSDWPMRRNLRVLDIGAHQGGFLETLNEAISNTRASHGDERRHSYSWPALGGNQNISIVSFEPNPISFANLQERTHQYDNIQTVRCAISDKNNEAGFIYNPPEEYGSAVAELTSLSAISVANFIPTPTAIWSLDAFFSNLGGHGVAMELDNADIFLKMDVEGFEPMVFEGAHALLSGQLRTNYLDPSSSLVPVPKIVLFEYGQAWTIGADSGVYRLETVVEKLQTEYGYQSFLLGPDQMVRLDGTCWNDDYEFWYWSNVVAVLESSDEKNLLSSNADLISDLYSRIMNHWC